MSNNQVGTVYQQIIQDVVESSRVDFEEGGVDEHVLEELKSVSLSPFSHVCQFRRCIDFLISKKFFIDSLGFCDSF
jgi:transcription initiation factor TFIIA large subunit